MSKPTEVKIPSTKSKQKTLKQSSWCQLNGFPKNVHEDSVREHIREVLNENHDETSTVMQLVHYKRRSSVVVQCGDAKTADTLMKQSLHLPFDGNVITAHKVLPNHKVPVPKKNKNKEDTRSTCIVTKLPTAISADTLIQFIQQEVMKNAPDGPPAKVVHLLNEGGTSRAIVRFSNHSLLDFFVQHVVSHRLDGHTIHAVKCKIDAVLTKKQDTQSKQKKMSAFNGKKATGLSGMHQESTTCMITRLPKAINEQALVRYIQLVLGRKVDDDPPTVNQMKYGSKRCKAIVRFTDQESLERFLKMYPQHKFGAGSIRVVKCRADAVFSRKEDSKELPPKRESSDDAMDYSKLESIARGFHDYLCKHPDQMEAARDRDRAGQILASCLHYSPEKKEEAAIMARMRRLKLLKSRKLKSGQVLMIYADDNGVFPDLDTVKNTRAKVMEMHEEKQKDKGGVKVTNVNTISVKLNEKAVVQFEIVAEDEAQSVELQGIQLTGTHAKTFGLEVEGEIPLSITSDPQIAKLSLVAPRVGCFKVNAHFQFQNSETKKGFGILRFAMVRASRDPEMEAALQPITPYTKPNRQQYRSKSHAEVHEAPPHPDSAQKQEKKKKDKKKDEDNPFAALPAYRIPPDVKDLVIAQELGTVLEKPEGRVDGLYGRFWQNLLWASEFQAKLDIQMYDMKQVSLKQEGQRYILFVPGLAEARPSVLRGDEVHIILNNNKFKGRVMTTRLLEAVLEFHPAFGQRFNPSLDTVDVQFTFSRMTFRTCHEGCRVAETTMAPLLVPSMKDPDVWAIERAIPSVWKWGNRFLNKEQKSAIENVVCAEKRPLPYIIFGPPGTGKTTTVVEAVYQLCKHEDNLRILLVAPSNDAADILVERLSQYFPPSELCRVLAYSRTLEMVPAAIQAYAREKVSEHEKIVDILKMKLVVATVNYAARLGFLGVPRGHFDVLCVDEAGHATEPELVSMVASLMDFTEGSSRCGQLILAGDPKQLGPIVTSSICRQFGLETSYMERLTEDEVYTRKDGAFPKELITKLVRNYRSHPSILKLPNEMFYDGELVTSSDLGVSHNLAKWEHLPNQGFPIVFHSIEGENLREGNSPSWYNPQEAMQVVEYVNLLLNETRPPLKPDEIGIITPYHRQAQKIRLGLDKKGIGKDIKVGSVEVFQGQERRCIILSTVRSETEHLTTDLRFNLGFVANKKRFNVAITRAKALLIVIGCPRVLALDKENWHPFMAYCLENGGWVGDEWDPHADDDTIDVRDEEDFEFDSDDGEEVVVAPSQMIQQGGTGFIAREE